MIRNPSEEKFLIAVVITVEEGAVTIREVQEGQEGEILIIGEITKIIAVAEDLMGEYNFLIEPCLHDFQPSFLCVCIENAQPSLHERSKA